MELAEKKEIVKYKEYYWILLDKKINLEYNIVSWRVLTFSETPQINKKMSRTANYLALLTTLTATVFCNLSYTPPKIVQEPPEISYGFTGQSLQLPCQATGTPAPEYTWRKGNVEVDVKSGGKSIQNGYLIIDSFTAADAGDYQCVVRMNIGQRELLLNSIISTVVTAGK